MNAKRKKQDLGIVFAIAVVVISSTVATVLLNLRESKGDVVNECLLPVTIGREVWDSPDIWENPEVEPLSEDIFISAKLLRECAQQAGISAEKEGPLQGTAPQEPTEPKEEVSVASGSRILIPMNNILQRPELPTGCEATSLTMVLNYLGIPLSKM